MKIKVLIAAHKPYWFPADPCYLPIEVGAALRTQHLPGCIRDDTGENISRKNPHYCELTALYWAWKNLDADAIGLVHYRRHLGNGSHGKDSRTRVADGALLQAQLEKAPVLLPKAREYFIESNYSQYSHAHHKADLIAVRSILAQHWPDYLPAFDRNMRETHGHHFNMFVMRRDLFDRYCSWLFDVLFRLEDVLDISSYSAYDQRVFGFVSERLLDCWLMTNHSDYTELPMVNLEPQNWLKKGSAFLLRICPLTRRLGQQK